MRTWQEITCLLAMVVFILVIGAFVFSYASRQYAVKNIDGIPASAGEEESRRHRMIRKIVTVGCSIAAAAIVVVIVLLMPKDTAGDYTKVAEFLTEDTRMGPMEYGDAVYVPVNEEADLEKNGIAQGYLAERGERCDSRFYQLAIANLLYTDPTGKTNLVQTAGTDGGTYAPVALVETDKAWETDDVFLLWDEDWALESAYSHEPTGYVACPADLIRGLRMQFPDVTYRTAGGMMRALSSAPDARMLVSCLALVTLTTRSFSWTCSPTTCPAYTSSCGLMKKRPRSCSLSMA